MSWICKNCETENPDTMGSCEVCGANRIDNSSAYIENHQSELSISQKGNESKVSQIVELKTELKRIQDKLSSEKKRLSEITWQKGYEILNLRRDNEQLKEKITELVHGKRIRERIIGLSVAFIAILFVFLLGPTIKDLVSPKPSDGTDIFPQELSGDYMVRKMNGADGIDATIKIYCEGEAEGDGYVMKVYSASKTQEYTFTYNPTNGEIKSTELGKGRARIKEITNETEISFTGWEIIK